MRSVFRVNAIHRHFLNVTLQKRVVCLSILMQSTNRSCNTLQTALGIFLHSCGTLETVRELLAHMGLSISTTSINEAISNLSGAAIAETRKIGTSLLTTYAYNNLDIDLIVHQLVKWPVLTTKINSKKHICVIEDINAIILNQKS